MRLLLRTTDSASFLVLTLFLVRVLRVQSEIPQQVQSSAGQKKLYVLQLSISDVNADLLRNRLRACQVGGVVFK